MKFLKNALLVMSISIGSVSIAAPTYTLQQICTKFGNFNQCQQVPFCQETIYQTGCYLAPGAPAYIEPLCKNQLGKQGCDIMASQGNCIWIAQSGATCNAKTMSL